MTFTPQVWVGESNPLGPPANPGTATPLNPSNLEAMQQHVYDGVMADVAASYARRSLLPFNANDDIYTEGVDYTGGSGDFSGPLQAALDAAGAVGGRVVWPAPASYYSLQTPLVIEPPGGGPYTSVQLEGSGKPWAFRWEGGDNTTVFHSYGWKRFHASQIDVQVPSPRAWIVVWEFSGVSGNQSAGYGTFYDCSVALGGTNGRGWRYGHDYAGTGCDISFLTHHSCRVESGSSVPLTNGNVGHVSEHANVLNLVYVDCNYYYLGKIWTNYSDAGAASAAGGASAFFYGCGNSHTLIDYEFITSGQYGVWGGRYEEGATFMSLPGGGSSYALFNIVVSGTLIDAYNPANGRVINLMGAAALTLSGIIIASRASIGAYTASMISLATAADKFGSMNCHGCAFSASDPFYTISTGNWDVTVSSCVILDLSGSYVGTGLFDHGRVGRSSNCTMMPSWILLGITSTAAPRTVTLSPLARVPPGTIYRVVDESNAAGTNNITVTCDGTEKFFGSASSIAISTNGGSVSFYHNGSSWIQVQ